MSRRKPKVEILPPAESGGTLPERVEDSINRLVDQKIAEALGGQPDLMAPWFLSRKEATEIRRRQTVHEQRKWSIYFERFGCVACKRDNQPHAGNGLCKKCRPEIHNRLNAILKELKKERT